MFQIEVAGRNEIDILPQSIFQYENPFSRKLTKLELNPVEDISVDQDQINKSKILSPFNLLFTFSFLFPANVRVRSEAPN
jgi:hypothetical protein